ncbi:Hpt domain-containing protein [Denitrificimonas caeni]|uniref:Hpt domain-containing protein n=1 Tax=Denitrificimonas caeni TaxID=521720 RepID=UPI0003B3C81F|nr:Hpt domain-containing protein [Denitrificimonas caeni]
MGDRHDYVALEWVKGEIAETLKQARHALEEFVENPEDSTRLRFCLTYVHQVHGTLQMVEFFGAALLAEEMEQLAQALLENRVNNLAESLEVMMQAILQLPLYLDRIQTARRDLPMVVLPLLNDLRAARGEKLLSETSLFTPTFQAKAEPLSAARLQELSVPALPLLLRKLRQMLQVALVGVLRGQDLPTNLGYMARVFARLETLSKDAPLETLWQVSAGLVDGLANGSVEAGASVRTLLRQVDRELRRLVAEQAPGLNQPASIELIKNILFYVAKAQANSERLQRLHEQYRLDEALPNELLLDEERARMAGPDRGAMRSVVAALCEELVRIKDNLDLFVRSDRSKLDELSALQIPLKQIADTLAVLGFAQPRKVVLDQIEVVASLVNGSTEPSEAVLMDVAGALLYIEATLTGMAGSSDDIKNEQNLMPTTDVRQIHRLVIKEARTGLEHAKDGIIEFIASQWNHEHLAKVPYLLNQVRGGLVMIPLERAAALVETCRRYIEEQLFEQKMIPNWQNLDTLADAITSVEYYLERLVEDHASQGETILDVAEESLTSLGYSPYLPLTVASDDVLELESEQDVADTLEVETAEHEPLAETDWSTIALDTEADSIAHQAVETEALPTFASDSFIASGDAVDLPAFVDDIELEIVENDFVPVEPLFTTEDVHLLATEATTDAEADFVIDLAPEINAVEISAEAELELSESKESEPALPASQPQTLDLSDIPDVELPQIIIAEASEHEPAELSLQDVMSSSVARVNPPATDVPPSILPPPADEEPIDEELQEVFVEEAEEVLETLNEFYPKWRANQDDQEALTEVRRAFHTLKGSGRMVRALVAGELAWSIENMLNRVIEGSVEVSEPLLQVIADVITLFPELVVEYAEQQQRQRDDVDQLAAIAHALARKEPLPNFSTATAVSDIPDWDASDDFSDLAEEDALEINLELPEQDVAAEADVLLSVEMLENNESIDPVLLDIFHNEAQAHLQTLVGFLADCAQQLPKTISDDLQRALHTLKGSAFMAGILPIAHIASVLEKLAKEYQANLLAVEFNEALLLSEAEQLLRIGIDQLTTTPLKEIEGSAAFIEKLEQVMHARLAHAEDLKNGDPKGARDPKIISTFLSEGMDILLDMDEQLQDWQKHPTQRQELAALLDELVRLGHSAEQAELPQVEDICNALLEMYQAVENGRLLTEERFFAQAKKAHDALINMMDQVAAGLQVEPQQECIDALYELMAEELQSSELPDTLVFEPVIADANDSISTVLETDLEPLFDEDFESDADLALEFSGVESTPQEPVEFESDTAKTNETEEILTVLETVPEPSADEVFSVSCLDEEMVEIFLEEAMDLLESAGESLEAWLASPQSNVMSALLRDLHTLKGGARMAEIKPIGDLAHEIESLYEGLLDGRYSHSDELGDMLLRGHDRLAVLLDQLQARQPMQQPVALIESMKAFRRGETAPLIQTVDTLEYQADIEISEATGQDISATKLETAVPANTAWDVVELEKELNDESVESDFPRAAAENTESFTLDNFDDELEESLVLPDAESVEPQVSSIEDEPESETVISTHDLRDPELVEIFLEEGFEIIESATAALLRWVKQTDNTLELETLQRDLHTLKGGARMAEIPEIGDLAHELEFLYEDLSAGKFNVGSPIFNLLQDSHDALAIMLEAVRDYKELPDGQALIIQIKNMRTNKSEQLEVPTSLQVQAAHESAQEKNDEVSSIFIIEADELLTELSTALTAFDNAPQSEQAVKDALRVLNTLKGGARLAEAQNIGNISHELESELLAASQQGQPWPENLRSHFHTAYQQLLAEVAKIRQTLPEHLLAQLLVQPEQTEIEESKALQLAQPIVAISEVGRKTVDNKVLPFVEKAQLQAAESSAQRAPQEQVRVPAELLEGLVNLAGETSIFRGRVEQQVSDFGFTLGEMEATIDRVRDQLRRLDTETQAQILSRYQAETEKAGYEDFDPLEMDRYSQLQQLSRALFESSSDLLDLKETLAVRNRDAETLLLQQARVNTELQEGLMRTRMVPFDRLLPRLRRVVRQVSGELGKKVEFVVANAEGEVDRTVLERMLAPLEHMLRNAVDHGIESAEQRQALDKPATGTIRLELTREGADILLVLSDDGAGINLDAVRNKAIERGLMTSDASLTDQEIMQFILHAGFSTAGQVTQISGRGVGMDVVSAEIKKIGGSISIDSTLDKGTTFYIRLPFTVSVNRALMVMAGEDSYAIPLNTIEGIVRISPYELEALYEQERDEGKPASFEYAGQSYELKYVGDLLNNGQHPKLVGQTLPLPVILVRSNEYAVAVQVDVLAGSREIVVKSMGPQFANVHGISGATILGDGRVVVILDLLAMIRTDYTRKGVKGASDMTLLSAVESDKRVATLVMVVDDSVTVRKVTTRLLERHGMNVLTAKDGMDAIAQLQETKPDIMLLDIEMPRMDGFEVATLVRHDEFLKDLPIIMITSRTGEKHRERAMAIGVNDYLGKPYQETVLLEAIHKLIKSDD